MRYKYFHKHLGDVVLRRILRDQHRTQATSHAVGANDEGLLLSRLIIRPLPFIPKAKENQDKSILVICTSFDWKLYFSNSLTYSVLNFIFHRNDVS
jgi:hypothetical protein